MIRIGVKRGELRRGTQIAYVPLHAGSNLEHPDVEFGFVEFTNERFAFCRYWSEYEEGELRTKANSEATPFDRIVIINQKPDSMVWEMLKKY